MENELKSHEEEWKKKLKDRKRGEPEFKSPIRCKIGNSLYSN